KGFRYFELPKYNAELEICNVDRFQGHEADIVLLSFVRSRAHGGGIGFLDNKNRFNVAITRARYQLLIFADKEHFMRKGTPLLRDYMNYLQENINYRREAN
ncbi:MAG: AAA domain-containing protein, partial [Euryarchaeota archaeon]|nr:AAA domain-containing protein [Euryarchaeota archaeon]